MTGRTKILAIAGFLAGLLIAFSVIKSVAVQKPDSVPADENTKAVTLGRAIAEQRCVACHDISERIDDEFAKTSPPSFYAVANARTTTAMGLNVFFVTPHAPMPNLIISPEDRAALIAYILSLREGTSPST